MDLEKAAQKLLAGKDTAALDALAGSALAGQVAAQVDGAAVEKAAREGNGAALAELLKTVLATPEGRRFAGEVRKAVDGSGG